MSVIESYRNFVATVDKYNKLSDLVHDCHKIVKYRNFYSIDVMEQCISNDWKELFEILGMYLDFRHVKKLFDDLKEGHINREQFAEKTKCYFDEIDSSISKMKEELDTEESNFSSSYQSFFSNGLSNAQDLGSRMIYTTLLQPETKEIIMEFLKL